MIPVICLTKDSLVRIITELFLHLFYSDGYGSARATLQGRPVASSLYRGLPETSASLITFVFREQQGQFVDIRK
jgi:hypothetical protein